MEAKLLEHIRAGGTINIINYAKHIKVTPKVLARFEKHGQKVFKTDSKGSLYIARGKAWDCIDYCRITGTF